MEYLDTWMNLGMFWTKTVFVNRKWHRLHHFCFRSYFPPRPLFCKFFLCFCFKFSYIKFYCNVRKDKHIYWLWISILFFYGFYVSKDMDDDFVENVKSFVLHILSREMLTAKRIHNKTLTGEDIVKYIKVS